MRVVALVFGRLPYLVNIHTVCGPGLQVQVGSETTSRTESNAHTAYSPQISLVLKPSPRFLFLQTARSTELPQQRSYFWCPPSSCRQERRMNSTSAKIGIIIVISVSSFRECTEKNRYLEGKWKWSSKEGGKWFHHTVFCYLGTLLSWFETICSAKIRGV